MSVHAVDTHSPKSAECSLPGFLGGGGEMGARIRAHDWSATSLGPAESWPQNLRTSLRIMLASRQPMWVWWGEELINFYNDAYLPIIGLKHPDALGRPARQVWADIWDQIRARTEAAMKGQSSSSEAERFILRCNGHPEETYYTFSFSPVPDADGRVGGIICASTEETGKIVGARQLALLRNLASRTWEANSVEQVYALAAAALATDPHDMPFALLYGLACDGTGALLKATCGIARGHSAAPEVIALDAAVPWPIGEAARTGAWRLVSGLKSRFDGLPTGPWPDAPDQALLLPLSTRRDSAVRGALVIGLNPCRPQDNAYEGFARSAAREIASALVNVEAFEREHERASSADVLTLEIEHRRRIEQHQNLLLDELNHRVKNTLATVQAIAMQTLKGVDAAARDVFIARLFALSGQHDLLTLDNWEGASLEGVVRRALRPYREEGGDRFAIEGPAVHLEPKRALALGMAFHELASNAARYGALSAGSGQLRVTWAIDPQKHVNFRWEERGGPPAAMPARKGFGLRLIEHGLAREISGTVRLSFEPEGLVCEWDMPLP